MFVTKKNHTEKKKSLSIQAYLGTQR